MTKRLSAQQMLVTADRLRGFVADFFPNIYNAHLFVEINGASLNENEIRRFDQTSDVIYAHAEFVMEDDKITIKDDGTIDTLFLFNQEQLEVLNKMVSIFLATFKQ